MGSLFSPRALIASCPSPGHQVTEESLAFARFSPVSFAVTICSDWGLAKVQVRTARGDLGPRPTSHGSNGYWCYWYDSACWLGYGLYRRLHKQSGWYSLRVDRGAGTCLLGEYKYPYRRAMRTRFVSVTKEGKGNPFHKNTWSPFRKPQPIIPISTLSPVMDGRPIKAFFLIYPYFRLHIFRTVNTCWKQFMARVMARSSGRKGIICEWKWGIRRAKTG